MYQISLHSSQKRQLKNHLKLTTSVRIWKRLKTIDLHVQNYSHNQIAQIMDVNEDTVTNWIKIYKNGRIDNLKKTKYKSRTSSLDIHKTSIAKLIAQLKISTIKELQQQLSRHLHLQIGESGLYKWCKRNSVVLFS